MGISIVDFTLLKYSQEICFGKERKNKIIRRCGEVRGKRPCWHFLLFIVTINYHDEIKKEKRRGIKS